MAREIVIRKAEYRELPRLYLTREQKEEVKKVLDEKLKSKFPVTIDAKIVYDIAGALRELGLDLDEIMRRIANFRGSIETFTSPTVLRKISRKNIVEDDFSPKRMGRSQSLGSILGRIDGIAEHARKVPESTGYVAILTDPEGDEIKSLIDLGKFANLEIRDTLETHIHTKEWKQPTTIIPFLVIPKMHETDKILGILKDVIEKLPKKESEPV